MNLPLEIGELCNRLYGNNVDKIRIYPETKDTLEKLIMYKKGIITNTPKDSAIKILKKLEIEYYFGSVLTSDDVSMSKPDPEIVLKSCKLLDVEQKDVVLVGDTESDVRAGRAAGCIVIGLNVNADYIIRDLSELPSLFL